MNDNGRYDDEYEYEGAPSGRIKAALWSLVAAAIAVAAVLVFFVATARAHEAPPTKSNPLGWTYGWECCSMTDCAQSAAIDIEETSQGYVIVRTGELILYADSRIKKSKDEFFHRCTHGGDKDDKHSICLYVPNRGF